MKSVLKFILFLVLLSSIINMTYPVARYLILAFSLPLIFIFMLYKIKKVKINSSVFIVFILFIISSLISALFNSDTGSLINTLTVAYLYIFLAILFNTIAAHQQLSIMQSSILSSHITILIYSLVFFGITVPFKGMFTNPNAMGQLLIPIAVIVSSTFYQCIYNGMFLDIKTKKSKLLWYFILATIVLYLSIMTKSRTSSLSVLIIYILPLLYIWVKSLRKIKLKNVAEFIILSPFIALVVWLVVRFTNIFNLFNELILSKFANKSSDLTDGRSYVWKYTIDNTGLFGNGHSFFDDTVGAHNTFIDILGEYGWISLLFFIVFTLLIFLNSLKYLKSTSETDNRFLPFLIITAFIVASMTEGEMFKPLMIGMFLISGIITKPNEN